MARHVTASMGATRVKTLVRGGVVLTLGVRTINHVAADVLIEDGRIAEIGPGIRARDAEEIDARASIVMPGFVDAHHHAWTSLLRNRRMSATSDDAHDAAYLAEMTPDDVYASTLLGLLSAIGTGTTTLVDWSPTHRTAAHTDASLQAHHDAGIRSVLVHVADGEAGLDALVGLAADRQPNPMAALAFGHDGPLAGATETIAATWQRVRATGLRIHVRPKGSGPNGPDGDASGVAAAVSAGLLGDDVTIVHSTQLDARDLDAIAESSAGLVLASATEMVTGSGVPDIQALLDRSIRPGIGVGDEQWSPAQIFTQMRTVQSVQHATVFDLKLAGKAGLPQLLTTREVIKYATIDGARAVGLDTITGSLEVGKRADLLILSTDAVNISPVNDPIGAVVWGMDPSNVRWVFVDGLARVRDGELDADLDDVRRRARAARDRLSSAVSPLATPIGGSA